MSTLARFTAADVAEKIADEIAAGDQNFALRMLALAVDDLRQIIAADDRSSLGDFLIPPSSTGSERWNTLLAAAVGRELRRAGLDRPSWTYSTALATFWFVLDPPPLLYARIIQRTPPDFACLGIWIDSSAFTVV